jgi:hypothetical protein
MAILIGFVLAVAVASFARLVRFDRGTFYSFVLVVVAHYYVLFAAMAGVVAELQVELLLFALFATAAILGFRISQWLVVAGLAAHGLLDYVRAGLLAGSGVPPWWPGFCLAFDVTAAMLLAAILASDMRDATLTN